MPGPFIRRRTAAGPTAAESPIVQSVGRVTEDSSARQIVPASAYELKRRRVPRSADLVQAVAQIDASSDPTYLRDLMKWIADEYEERQGGTLVGLFGMCYLGAPYVDHRMSLNQGILEHYRPGDDVPPAFAVARPFARSRAYRYIEVYDDGAVIPIRDDGSQAV